MVRTPAQIIDDNGGPAAFGAAIGVDSVRVRMMKYRQKLPRAVWPNVSAAFPTLTTEVLLAAERVGDSLPPKRAMAA